MAHETATFAMGCFWRPQLLFSKLPGVKKTEVGYMGGDEGYDTGELSYETVCTGETGHAEVVQITFDPKKTSYEKLLSIFWENHNPTTLNRQGLDVGDQYRSAIFYHNETQHTLAEQTKQEQQEKLKKTKTLFGTKKIVTQIVKAGTFYKAEEYHQDYLKKNGRNTC